MLMHLTYMHRCWAFLKLGKFHCNYTIVFLFVWQFYVLFIYILKHIEHSRPVSKTRSSKNANCMHTERLIDCICFSSTNSNYHFRSFAEHRNKNYKNNSMNYLDEIILEPR